MLHTFRAQLLVYISLLMAFLLGVLMFSYHSSRAVIMGEAKNNVTRIAQQIEGQLAREGRDLLERAKMVRGDTALAEYAYIVLAVGAGKQSIQELYRRQFGWLPVSRVVLLSTEGAPLLGSQHTDLVERVSRGGAQDRHFYISGQRGLELVATASLRYRSQPLGVVGITRVIDRSWMAATREMSGGHLFLVQDGRVALTTAGRNYLGLPFEASSRTASLGNEEYLVRSIELKHASEPLPQLWFALPDARLMQRLTRQRNLLLGLAAAGSAAILLVGLMLLRNLSGPLGRMVKVVRAVSEGEFPEVSETRARDEVGYLINQFSGMVKSLRDKQEEINRIHLQLEEQATTDALTGCYNRRYLYDLYPKIWSEGLRHHKPLSVLLIDLDLFKGVNDHYGHLVGDIVLVQFARVLERSCRVSDFIFRLGGEEFLVLTSEGLAGAQALGEKIRAAVENTPMEHEAGTISLTVSVGLAQADAIDKAEALSAVLARADQALYAAKRQGRNRVASQQAVSDQRFRRNR
ncbi:MAG: diguanylate cyclase [Gammaproteobacteria bacterium]|nr:diguanylate cyclase [Gammaproteobacteria bacterium]NIR97511.1 diguanylate cyclase [Gammaproteobacteria bacterium]NIT63149.1 diguanylate cyclase [Gammaproteobacteria bacterium]NIV19268.1 diguanylate cyclase [Gammaproteobacteria bacterium]NIX10258.1 diguanylate cyclase [Gammaproteobacteria bacterium]